MEMLGSDGPGDKLFRLVTDPTPPAMYPTSDPSGGLGLGIFDSRLASAPMGEHTYAYDPTAAPPAQPWSGELSLFNRFRTFPRDEGSQLDQVAQSYADPLSVS